MRTIRPALFASVVLVVLATAAHAAPIVFSAAGANAAAIQPTVDAFRAVLGNLNPNNPGSVGSGRREINWDGVPAGSTAPNPFPGDFFNANTPGRARGVEFSTPGTGFQVSANAGSGTEEFNNINPLYSSLFAPFSAQKLFSALGSTITDVTFFVPGTDTPATTTAFGAVFTDVDQPASTSLEFFDLLGNSLGLFYVPSADGNETLSFLGVSFGAGELVARVRIDSGNHILNPDNLFNDPVVMDDFIYAEPQAVPEPATGVLISLGLVGARLAAARKRRLRRATGDRRQATGDRPRATGHGLQATGYRLQATGDGPACRL